MTGSELAQIYEFSYGAIQRNLDSLSHDDSMISPEPAGNCINWILGHMVTGRGLVLMLAGAAPAVLTDEEAAGYRRGSAALSAGGNAVDLARLKSAFEETQQRLIPALQALSDATLSAEVPEQFRRPPLMGTVGQALVRLGYHEGYHNGQIGILRRMAGKESAIK
ncbi:MAG TPA: DinB family protein [Candidatus Limnocylindrales bacterium]|nr:DinB family protein [Candidatus Limnocylindrales bacterium]